MLIDFYEINMKKLDERKNLLIERITSGSLQSFDDYRSLCGRLQELLEIKEIMKNTLNSFQNPNN